MHKGKELPLAPADMLMSEALPRMTEKSLGALGIVDDENKLLGVITDGDLRRHMSPDFLSKTAGEVMTKAPKTIPPTLLAAEALQLLNTTGITSFFVVADGQPVGFIHMHDLLRAGIA
jgi:arabinose-5-phosphate isomerase